jgi:hypothetical protein
MLTYDVCSRMLTYDVCSRMLTYDVCSRMLTYDVVQQCVLYRYKVQMLTQILTPPPLAVRSTRGQTRRLPLASAFVLYYSRQYLHFTASVCVLS